MLICAGSSHKGGDDTHRSANGIVQGHAYTVLDCIVAPGGEHLIQLRNPWGAQIWVCDGAGKLDQLRFFFVHQRGAQTLFHENRSALNAEKIQFLQANRFVADWNDDTKQPILSEGYLDVSQASAAQQRPHCDRSPHPSRAPRSLPRGSNSRRC